MTTLLLEDLEGDAMDMVLRLARLDVREFLTHAARHGGVLISWCSWHVNPDGTRGHAMGTKPAGGSEGGLSDGICSACAQVAFAHRARKSAERDRN